MQNCALVSFAILLIVQLVDGQQRWYYTGKFQNDEVATPFFEGLQYKQSELFDPNHSHLLYFGGTVARAEVLNVTNHEADVLMLLGLGNGSTVAVHNGRNYPLVMSRNYAAYVDILNNRSSDGFETLQYQAEVGLYDHRIREFLEKYWRDLQVGELTAVEITIEASTQHAFSVGSSAQDSVPVLVAMDVSASGETVLSASHDAPLIVDLTVQAEQQVTEVASVSTAVESEHDNAAPKQVHRVLYTSDIMGRASIYAHTWNTTHTTRVDYSQDTVIVEEKKDLRVMSFNLWHNNPPSWVYHNPRDRWDRYSKRLSHFADVVVASDPDIIALQEVRLDSSFLTPHAGHTLPHWQDLGLHKADAGNQAEHVLSYLAQARARAAKKTSPENYGDGRPASTGDPAMPYYQFVFQPAMSLIDSQRLQFRNEEGVMILSKYPIEDYQVILLPRAMNETSDDHQRVILKVKVRLPAAFIHAALDSATVADSAGSTGASDTVTVDVMTSHFSLSEVARNRGVRALVQGLTNSDSAPNLSKGSSSAYVNSPIQILTGDFNAEPHEDALQYLLDAENFVGSSTSPSGASEDESTVPQVGAPFVDAYTHIKSQNIRTDQEVDESDPLHVKEGFTFPACNPVKRIDFIMVRNHSNALDVNSAEPVASAAAEARTSAHIVAFRIEGTKPSADTEHLVGSREGLGMNDKDSPLWASDHFAVAADLRIVQSRL